MNILGFVFELTLFLLAVFICFFLPGKRIGIFLKLKLDLLEDVFFSTVIGMMLFTLIAYIFSWIRLESLILPLVLLLMVFTLKEKQWLPRVLDRKHLRPLFFMLCMAIFFSLNQLKMGVYGDSISYARDDVWHLALINELKAHFPPDYPGLAYVPLKGYHFFYDFLLAKLSNIFSLSPASLHFHFFPALIAVLWVLGVYVLMYRWRGSITAVLWAVFLTLFGGSFAFILYLQGHTGVNLDSVFGIMQPSVSLWNPSYSLSIVIIIATLFALYHYTATWSNRWLVPIVLCIGMVTMFKVYAGMILLSGFLVLCLIELWRRKVIPLVALSAIGFLFLFTYWILADHSARLLFQPLWPPHKMLEDNLPWYGYTEKLYTYTRLSVIRGLVEIEVYGLSVFIFGNLGTRLIGLFVLFLSVIKKRKPPSLFTMTVLTMAAIAILTPLFFLQTGQVYEIIQMAWYFLFFASLFASIGFAMFFGLRFSKILKGVLMLVILAMTLPSAYENYKEYPKIFSTPRQTLSSPYFKAMEFLRLQENYNATVLELPPYELRASDEDVSYWYRRGGTLAIVAFGNKRSFLSNQYITFPNADDTQRMRLIKEIIAIEKDNDLSLGESVLRELKQNNIVFLVSSYPLRSMLAVANPREVYKDEGIYIYKLE